MNVLIHQGGQVFLQLLPELPDGTKIDFNGAAQEVVADPSVVTVVTNPNNPSQIAVAAVGKNLGSTQVTITYTNKDSTSASLVLNVTVDPLDATQLAADQIGAEVPAGTAFPAPPAPPAPSPTPTPPAAAPVITGVSPNTGALVGGVSVSLSGTGFTGATAVAFGTTPAASFTVNGDTSITAISPALPAAGTFDVLVTTPAGTNAAGSSFSAS